VKRRFFRCSIKCSCSYSFAIDTLLAQAARCAPNTNLLRHPRRASVHSASAGVVVAVTSSLSIAHLIACLPSARHWCAAAHRRHLTCPSAAMSSHSAAPSSAISPAMKSQPECHDHAPQAHDRSLSSEPQAQCGALDVRTSFQRSTRATLRANHRLSLDANDINIRIRDTSAQQRINASNECQRTSETTQTLARAARTSGDTAPTTISSVIATP
jgi:hypothetical protein